MKGKKLKLDLHTHIWEATNFAPLSFSLAEKIVQAIKERNLDGIAITDHYDKTFAFQMKEIIESQFSDIIIIPGQEISYLVDHVVELYLPDGTFRFIAHPWDLTHLTQRLNGVHGIEIENGQRAINKDQTGEVAQKFGLLPLSNSDAHTLSDVGLHYNYIELEELSRRARL